MQFTILDRETTIGTVELPAGRFVAGRFTPAAEYASIRAVVRRSTEAFLHLGLFQDARAESIAASSRMSHWREALSDASRLQLRLIDGRQQPVATRFVNLLEAPDDDGVVALVSFRRGSSGSLAQHDPVGVAPAPRVGVARQPGASENQ